MTPEPRLCCTRSRGTLGKSKKRRKKGSSKNGLVRTWTRVRVCTLTTAGITSSRTGASDGIGSPPTAAGSAASTGGAKASRPAINTRRILSIMKLILVVRQTPAFDWTSRTGFHESRHRLVCRVAWPPVHAPAQPIRSRLDHTTPQPAACPARRTLDACTRRIGRRRADSRGCICRQNPDDRGAARIVPPNILGLSGLENTRC